MSTELVHRPNEVAQQIQEIKSSLVDRYLTLGRLLNEVIVNKYYQDYGFGSYEQWYGTSGLDLSLRSSMYLVKMVRRQEQLGIPDAVIEAAGFSNSKEILANLDETEATAEVVEGLLEAAEGQTVRETQDKIAKIKGREDVVLHFKVQREVRDDVVVPAFDLIRAEVQEEMSDSRCLELLCAAKLAELPETSIIDVEAEEL